MNEEENIGQDGIDFGDKHVLNHLELLHKAFVAGDKAVLFGVIAICARYQAVIPEWATDEILMIEDSIKTGGLKDFNAAFGWVGENLASRKRNARLEKNATDVLNKMQKYRLEGGSLNSDEMFQSIADDLEISRRDIEDIYKREGQFIKELPRGNPEKGSYCISRIEIPRHRRHGRPILKD